MTEKRCSICDCKMIQNPNVGDHPRMDCGGHCATCMAMEGDPYCILSLLKWVTKLVEREMG